MDFTKDDMGHCYLLVSYRLYPSPNCYYNSIIKISPGGIKLWEIAISPAEQWAGANITKIKFSKYDNTLVVSGASP